MLSRVASSVYWMSRYVERAENVARSIDVHHNLMLDSPYDAPEQWRALVATTGDHELFDKKYPEADREGVIRFLAFDRENPNSIISCLTQARENARSVRPALSMEVWEYVNRAFLMIRSEPARQMALDSTYDFCSNLRELCYLFAAAMDGSMSHGEAWSFAHLGRMLERADQTSRIVDVKYFVLLPSPDDVGTPLDAMQWAAMLKSVSGFAMYRQCFGRITPANVARFLILDDKFPRAIRFCLIEAENAMRAITSSPPGTYKNGAERLLGRLRSRFDYTQIEEVFSGGMHEFLDDTQRWVNRIDDAVSEAFFHASAGNESARTESPSPVAPSQTQS